MQRDNDLTRDYWIIFVQGKPWRDESKKFTYASFMDHRLTFVKFLAAWVRKNLS